MNTGMEFREAFMDIMNEFGQSVILHKNWKQPNSITKEIKGLKNTEKGPQDKKIVFQFPDKHDISKGDILQLKQSTDYWSVVDTEDNIVADTYVYFKAYVIKVNQ